MSRRSGSSDNSALAEAARCRLSGHGGCVPVLDGCRLRGDCAGPKELLLAMARSWTSVLVGEGAPMGLEASQCALGRVEAAWRAISLFDREKSPM